MVKKCAAQFCSNSCATGHSIHVFPKECGRRKAWKRFVDIKRANFTLTKDSVLCNAHFSTDCYANAGISAWSLEQGYGKRMVLKSDAIPTIHTIPTQAQLDKARGVKRKHDVDDTATGAGASTSTTRTFTPPPLRSRAVSKLEVARVSHVNYNIIT